MAYLILQALQVKSAFGWVRERLGETVDGIINVFTGSDGFDTHSPSRVFAKIGENLMRGLEGGSKENVDLVKAQMVATVDVMKGAFSNISTIFTNIGHNAMNALTSSLGGAINSLSAKVANLMNKITSAAKKALKIKSPSKVFAEIGEFMALGLEQGWEDEFGGIKRSIENGLNFGTASIGLSANTGTRYGAQAGQQGGFMGGNSYNFTFNSPEALDPVAASRKAKRAAQMMALGYV